jgi:hypothetical protein
MKITKRRMLLGVAGVLAALMISAPVAAGGQNHGTVDVNDVTGGAHGGLVNGSDGNDRNINAFNSVGSVNLQITFNYEENVEFDPEIGAPLRVTGGDEPSTPSNSARGG